LPPIDHLRVIFNRPMDPSTFTTDRITRFTGPNGDIDVTAIVPVPGTRNTQFDITFAPQGTTGRYSMSIDAVMDLYGNQTPQFTAQFGVQGPRIISNSVAQAKPGIDRIRVTFNESMDPLTFTADKIATFTGPAGPIMVTDVVAVPGTNNTAFDILFDAQSTPGSYTMVIGPDIRDPFGNPMDQNNNLIPGETPGDQFTYHLTITAAGPGGGARPPDATEDTGYTLPGFLLDWRRVEWFEPQDVQQVHQDRSVVESLLRVSGQTDDGGPPAGHEQFRVTNLIAGPFGQNDSKRDERAMLDSDFEVFV
jgi:hypothetical protein